MKSSQPGADAPILCIACGVFRSDLDDLLQNGSWNIDVEYLPGGLHSEPQKLRAELQKSLDAADAKYERIILLYGLCGKGIVSLRSGERTLVLPRAHDCISLFLGGTEEYRKQFAHAPGTYYISAGWYEEQIQPRGVKIRYPEQYVDNENPEEWEKRYGRKNAEEIGGFLNSWKKNYTRAVYVDTGSKDEPKYEAHAKELAEENDWEYKKLTGSRKMIIQCLNATDTDKSVLVVPPGHELYHDTGAGTINSAPVGMTESLDRNLTIELPADGPLEVQKAPSHRIGLGIDAGGTYTDAVIYDFSQNAVLAKAKALTTKWLYSQGIMEAVSSLPQIYLDQIDLVSVSTTLVTNAVVESDRRPVGLILMPNGTQPPADLSHQPQAVVKGRTTIGGDITENIDADEIISVIRKMISHFHVEAFAVSGYGGSINPALELQVKEIIRRQTDLEVCCGHELSGSLNFSVRAVTAVLNAGVLPIMESFLKEMEVSISNAGIEAPILVVRGDGAVMSESYAREFPVQTALSGPAASMAGAMFLTGLKEAAVVDVGGTTSDIGFIEDGRVAVCDDGARIGDWDTHIQAVEMLTTGLGGDSEIVFERLDWILGPRRITPVSWLGSVAGYTDLLSRGMASAAERLADWSESTVQLQYLYRTGKQPDFEMTSRERAVYEDLEHGPLMIWQIRERLGTGSWRMIKTGRLESGYVLQRAGLTPTDLYHAGGDLSMWNSDTAITYLNLIAGTAGISADNLQKRIRDMISLKMGSSLLLKIFGDGIGAGSAIDDILNHGNDKMDIIPKFKVPVIGLGAPASLMMRDIMDHLGGQLTLCEHGDVANAIGAITSKVHVSRKASIAATSSGGFRIHGIDGEDSHYESLDEAEKRCIEALAAMLRILARKAGTSEAALSVTIGSDVARTAEGSELFIERRFRGDISGMPDLV